jgi:beta-galactosidase/beta-glucuronidase
MIALEDWSGSKDEKIRYYAGTAVYNTSVVLGAVPAGETVYLDLGKVGIMAEVKVNGQSAGGVWTAPYRVDISKLVIAGENSIEVTVVNNWVNRLIGDSKLPEKERKTWINVNDIKPSDPLQSSGLLGPVTIVSVKY